MDFTVKSGNPEKQRTACIVLGVFEPRRLSPVAEQLDEVTGGYISNLIRRGDLEGFRVADRADQPEQRSGQGLRTRLSGELWPHRSGQPLPACSAAGGRRAGRVRRGQNQHRLGTVQGRGSEGDIPRAPGSG